LREVERLRPFKTALGEHLKHRFNALALSRLPSATKIIPGKLSRFAGEHPGAAVGAEVSI
jgi:hypothetical protein